MCADPTQRQTLSDTGQEPGFTVQWSSSDSWRLAAAAFGLAMHRLRWTVFKRAETLAAVMFG